MATDPDLDPPTLPAHRLGVCRHCGDRAHQPVDGCLPRWQRVGLVAWWVLVYALALGAVVGLVAWLVTRGQAEQECAWQGPEAGYVCTWR